MSADHTRKAALAWLMAHPGPRAFDEVHTGIGRDVSPHVLHGALKGLERDKEVRFVRGPADAHGWEVA